jgi:SAM-dependent methyltransferase
MSDRESSYAYPGGELALFANARNWKSYFAERLRPNVRGAVLEVGAGMGATTEALWHPGCSSWTCLEPDPSLAGAIDRAARSLSARGANLEVRATTIAGLDPAAKFDTILYIDVIEHIEDDRAELARAADRLLPGGRLVVLAPAHQRLYTPFDAAIGHHRRYSADTLAALSPPGLRELEVFYLDSVGLLASLANRLLLRQSMPTPRQIAMWDSVFVPASVRLDALLRFRLGKTVVGVWER